MAVWRWPGPQTPERLLMRRKLASSGSVRAGLFLSSALAFLAELEVLGAGLVAFALLLFVIGLLQAVRVTRSTR